jgi:hypothetical protein
VTWWHVAQLLFCMGSWLTLASCFLQNCKQQLWMCSFWTRRLSEWYPESFNEWFRKTIQITEINAPNSPFSFYCTRDRKLMWFLYWMNLTAYLVTYYGREIEWLYCFLESCSEQKLSILFSLFTLLKVP